MFHAFPGIRSCGLMAGAVLIATATFSVSSLNTSTATATTLIVGRDSRATLGSSPQLLATEYRSTGVIECGGMRSTGQLTGRGDTVTSAAHAFFDENGRSRAERGRCVFIVDVGGGKRVIRLNPDPARCGSTSPYGTGGHHDWAVARLDETISELRPYRIGALANVGQTIMMVSDGPGGKVASICRIRAVIEKGDGGPREIRTDCTGAGGMSGAAYLTPGPNPAILGVHVGFRSRQPHMAAAYSDTHYTFGAAAERAFGAAIVR